MKSSPDILGYLEEHLTSYQNSLPSQIISGGENEKGAEAPQYKAQKNWFQGVVGGLDRVIQSGLLADDPLCNRIQQFIEFVCSPSFTSRDTIQEDIDLADGILEATILHVRSRLESTSS